MQFEDDIFVIDSWPDNDSKKQNLINLINRLKEYDATILLTGHYPIAPEIQKMVDYYLYDRNNPLLTRDEFGKYNINSVRWSQIGKIRIENHREFHHDYAIWESMRNAFNFCKYLGKKYIHFLEYDNLPDLMQYRQAFIEDIRRFDAVIYEYDENSSLATNDNPYCATFIFSIRTDIAVRTIDTIKNKAEFFQNKPDKWQLEKNFLNALRSVTKSIFVSRYIPNDNELNIQAAWNRDGINRNGTSLQFYLAADPIDNLHLHIIGAEYKDELIEVVYESHKRFYDVKKNQFLVYKLGKYQKGSTVNVYHQGREIFNESLSYEIDKFKELNKIIVDTKVGHTPKQVNINFIDGPFVEILDDVEREYHVQFINKRNNVIEYQLDLKSNHWAKSAKKYHINWIVKIKGIDNDYYYEHTFDPINKKVLIGFESKSLGDTLAWMPYVEKFRVDNKCKVVCSTFHNTLFRKQYPEIEFTEPGSTVFNLYALYRIGLFYDNNKWDKTKHFTDPKKEPLTKIASDILGLDYVELRPKLPVLTTEKKKMVSIGVHGTAQCKYWNNPTGWQEVVDFLLGKGYEVRLLSKEGESYMGNNAPKGVKKCNTPKTEDALKIIQESELFIGISSGLSWLAWGAGVETILISGFTNRDIEPLDGVRRIINEDVCHGCWSDFVFDPGDWNWCPRHKGTSKHFECSKVITSEQVIDEIKKIIKD